MIRHRGDASQAGQPAAWLTTILSGYARPILVFDAVAAQVWGKLMVPGPGHPTGKQIAATALVHDVTAVSRDPAIRVSQNQTSCSEMQCCLPASTKSILG